MKTLLHGHFPASHYQLTVYVKLTDAKGKYTFTLELVDLSNDRIIGRGMMSDVEIPHPLAHHELVFDLRGLDFEHKGKYEFRLLADGEPVQNKSFQVKQIVYKEEGAFMRRAGAPRRMKIASRGSWDSCGVSTPGPRDVVYLNLFT